MKEYLKEKQLPLKCIYVMHATAHPKKIDDDLTDCFDLIKVRSVGELLMGFQDVAFLLYRATNALKLWLLASINNFVIYVK